MYMKLLNIRYQHEYFDGTSLFDMNCFWSPGVNKRIQDMGLIIVPMQGELAVMVDTSLMEREEEIRQSEDPEGHSQTTLSPEKKLSLFRQEFLERWGEEHLTLYFTPKEPEEFYNVTAGLDRLVSARKSVDAEGKTIILDKCFRFFDFSANADEGSAGVDLPVSTLDKISTLDELGIQTDNSDQDNKSVVASSDIRLLKKIVNHQVLFVVSLRISELKNTFDKDKTEPSMTLYFNAAKIHYKYYFTKIAPDDNLHVVAEDDTAFRGISYSPVTEQQGGKELCVFISNQPVRLRRQHEKHFKLVRGGMGKAGEHSIESAQTVISKLPHPSPARYYKHTMPNQAPINVLEVFIN